MQSSKIIEPSPSIAPSDRANAPLPLLPALLLKPSALLWLWALPLGILTLLNLHGYQLIKGNMNAAEHHAAALMGAGLIAIFLSGVGGWIFSRVTGRTHTIQTVLHPAWAIASIIFPASYLWFAVASMDDVLPLTVRAWLYPGERFLYNQFAFAMLPIFWGILRLAGSRPATGFGRAISTSAGVTVATPLILYLGLTALTSAHLSSFSIVIFASVIVVAGIIMFIAACRVLLLAAGRIPMGGTTAERVTIVLLGLILPIGGLILNRHLPFPKDFQAWEVYALVVVNCGILLLASLKHADWPQGSLYLLSATLPFSLYFFIVFLPFTPLAIIAVIAAGAGFLIFTPVLLFLLHLSLFHKARVSLAGGPRERRVLASCALCFLLLPGFFTVRGLADRVALNAALDYLYSPSIQSTQNKYPSSRLNLQRALNNHRKYKNGISYPLLSPFYSWLVFDNLVLPDDKIAALEKTFFGGNGLKPKGDPFRSPWNGFNHDRVRDRDRMPRAPAAPRTVELQQLHLDLNSAGPGTTVMTLRFTLQNNGLQPAEYVQSLPLPAGVYVAGFRLQIDGKLVPGRITEKKTALWVYTMIRDSERRDPGLLYYQHADELELRVFPVIAAQPSVVEIDFLIPVAAVDLAITPDRSDPGKTLRLAGDLIRPALAVTEHGIALVGVSPASALPPVPREIYFHLIVDRSAQTAFTGTMGEAIASLQKSFPQATRARVTLANYESIDVIKTLTPLNNLAHRNTAELTNPLPLSGGFTLDRTLAAAIRQHRDEDLNQPNQAAPIPPQPIFVVLGDNVESSPLSLDLASQWSVLLPQLSVYQLRSDGSLRLLHGPEGVISAPLVRLGGMVRPVAKKELIPFEKSDGPIAIDSFDPSTNRWRALGKCAIRMARDKWSQAVDLQLAEAAQSRSPGDAKIPLGDLVKLSRDTEIMIPATSYIVVENSAQWRTLEASERQKLGQNSALAFRETPVPSTLMLIFAFAASLTLRRARTTRSCHLTGQQTIFRRTEN